MELLEEIDYKSYSLLELGDEIENLFNKIPKDKRKKQEVFQWKTLLNSLIELYNEKASFKTYLKIK